jgi:hypothetical protein
MKILLGSPLFTSIVKKNMGENRGKRIKFQKYERDELDSCRNSIIRIHVNLALVNEIR